MIVILHISPTFEIPKNKIVFQLQNLQEKCLYIVLEKEIPTKHKLSSKSFPEIN